MSEKLLEVKDLKTYFFSNGKEIRSVDGVSLYVNKGETLGVVGESGSGKSVTALSIMGLVPNPPGRVVGGEILFDGQDLLQKSQVEMCSVRGNDISMIYQEPMTSLNPVFKCGEQIAEALRVHHRISHAEARKKAIEMLRLVGIPSPEQRANDFPHQLSGGMRQRVMIAMALICRPKLLIADEPTTALDVTIQAQILTLMKKLKQEIDMAIMIITHDLGVVAEMADRVVVMYAGKIVEEADVKSLFKQPLHPYTQGLLKSIPRLDEERDKLNVIEGSIPSPLELPSGCRFSSRCPHAQSRCSSDEPKLEVVDNGRKVACWYWKELRNSHDNLKITPTEVQTSEPVDILQGAKDRSVLVEIKNIKKLFAVKGGLFGKKIGTVKAVDGVSFSVNRGETFGLVGESGCGKTTLGKVILKLIDASEGNIIFEGKDILATNKQTMRGVRRDMQVVFQDPYASLNPRMSIAQILSEPLEIHGTANSGEKKRRIKELLETVGLSAYHLDRYPHEFSGGQRQRIGIARALALNPKLIILDEPVSALDVSIQSQVLNLLDDLQKEFNLSYIFIAHGLAAVKHISDRVGVMYLGKMVEIASSEDIYRNAAHPYTKALMAAIPLPDPEKRGRERIILEGDVPSPIEPPSGCRFHTRCNKMMAICKEVEPDFVNVGKDHFVACHLVTKPLLTTINY